MAEKLKSFGLKLIYWYGSCEANRVSTGQYHVPKDAGGMYALVFDNTFSKQISKKATFVLLTYPTDAPPPSTHHDHHIHALTNESSRISPRPIQQNSSDSVKRTGTGASGTRTSDDSKDHSTSEDSNYFTGVLQKRRRKKHQGWGRRFFSLNFTTSTLSYYHDRNNHALRGTVPLSVAAIGANAKTKQISIDSGAEIWHLKASNDKDFQAWKRALEAARASSAVSPVAVLQRGRSFSAARPNPEEDREWTRAEVLLSRVEKSRDLAKAIAKDTDPKYLVKPISIEKLDPSLVSGSSSPSENYDPSSYFNEAERRPFWKRKASSDKPASSMFKRSVSANSSTPQRSAPPTPGLNPTSSSQTLHIHPEEAVHDRCMDLLRELDVIAQDFSQLLQESKRRRNTPVPTVSRQSLDSQGSDEYFDAEGSQLLAIEPESEDDEVDEIDDSESSSDYDEASSIRRRKSESVDARRAFPSRVESLDPLPTEIVKRRSTVPASTVAPPSLISFFRKNVGKDLSTISMPVSANEPISLVQRLAESMEYSQLLDTAALATTSMDRLLHISAFAVSMLSNSRVKERAARKPFNPMLGETFELVREDRGFRFLAEKVSHRPIRLACQADSREWTFTQAPLPTQKFWGKSAEIVTEGKFRVVLHSTGDRFSWCPATNFLRNILAGEKYVEPAGTMDIFNETTNERAEIVFKSKGMFSGRLEDVVAQVYASDGQQSGTGLVGKWTASLSVTENGFVRPSAQPLWTTGSLVPDAVKHYGFTTFAASLNETTPIENGKLPPTDSRLRPDQRAAEVGDLDSAENLKAKLEEAQRCRRKQMEDDGEDWQPKWFRKLDALDGVGEEVWVAKTGGESYWEKRKQADWRGVENILNV